MTALQAFSTHYRAVRDRLESKPQKREWYAPHVVEMELPCNSLRALVRYIATKYSLNEKELIESDGVGNRRIVQARREMYYRAYQTMPSVSTEQMARVFKRDHTTIIRVALRHAERNNLPLERRPVGKVRREISSGACSNQSASMAPQDIAEGIAQDAQKLDGLDVVSVGPMFVDELAGMSCLSASATSAAMWRVSRPSGLTRQARRFAQPIKSRCAAAPSCQKTEGKTLRLSRLPSVWSKRQFWRRSTEPRLSWRSNIYLAGCKFLAMSWPPPNTVKNNGRMKTLMRWWLASFATAGSIDDPILKNLLIAVSARPNKSAAFAQARRALRRHSARQGLRIGD
jgi:hypothetical protein